MITTIATIPLSYDVDGDATTHTPLVRGSIAGSPTRLVLDTGCDVQILTDAFARAAGLRLGGGEDGVDHAEATVASAGAVDVVLELDDLRLPLPNTFVIPTPPAFARMGIGGILSPQHLLDAGYAIIDLARDELVLTASDPAPDAVRDWLVTRWPDGIVHPLARDPDFGAVVVAASITPDHAVPTILNTGGKATEFDPTASGCESAAPEVTLGHGVSGVPIFGRPAGARHLHTGDVELPVSAVFLREMSEPPHGIVGMDVLHGTVLAVTADPRHRVLWQLPQHRIRQDG